MIQMVNHYGGIFKINRLQKSIVQEYIVNKYIKKHSKNKKHWSIK